MNHPTDRPTNRLASETSPYLLQHRHNPVDWYPWGEEAFARARAEDRPIFLSVGYSACHWCHVMERECFENDDIARLMNDFFINVKVDREERPDVDQIYMAAVQAMSGQGGWPMSVFLTPDGRPFWGGTYFPPRDIPGRPGFPRVLRSIHEAWTDRKESILNAAGELTGHLGSIGQIPASDGELDASLLDNATRHLTRAFDPRHGGFGPAPKFPHPMDLRVLLRAHARSGDEHALHMVRFSLDAMARGGIYDHLGGGFSRYSTDDEWLVPHFEKMLYDNALLGSTYVEAFQLTGDAEFSRVAREVFDYVIGRMTDPEGGFHATEDADSEGEEGKYYVWTLDEIRSVLGPDRADVFASVYDVTARGNWEGKTILRLPKPLDEAAAALGKDAEDLRRELAEDRARLLEARARRVPPGKDTKILTSWNGLMIAALADGAHALGEERYLDAAERAAGFILDRLRTSDGRLLHCYKDGKARFNAYLDDYANLIDGLTRLFEATGRPRWVASALALADVMVAQFLDAEQGGFFYTGVDHEALITRPKDVYDNATPSGNAMAATALARLARLSGRSDLEEQARRTLRSVRLVLEQAPMAAGQSLIALDFLIGPSREIAVIGGEDRDEQVAALRAIRSRFLPLAVVAPTPPEPDDQAEAARLVPLLIDRPAKQGRATIYVCENFTCQEPVFVDRLAEALGGG
ncbi:thioredoxin domain-containing protein [Tautonia sociabilis]|uniref:Thioredoxin domain-containing protein n=1 Tax=Tautonia sociabilis TaxID=2080755 RepID=A0A432MRS4_9BACT|nr:thioredoxin domain-containing protein [Tautonia sociabilis]RUL89645.1 thioredoxin domain-containing protein [Tautonia sociabilis]